MREAGCFFIHELHGFARMVCFSTNIIAALPLGSGAAHRDISTRILKTLNRACTFKRQRAVDL
jgi:hypothetical protein